MTMIFVSPDIGVHEKLDLILNQTHSKFFTKMTHTKSFLNPKIGLKVGPKVPSKKKPTIKIGTKGSLEIKTRQHLSSHPNPSTEE
jgi:hypothetical protein